jgi:hypothetical protein
MVCQQILSQRDSLAEFDKKKLHFKTCPQTIFDTKFHTALPITVLNIKIEECRPSRRSTV